MELNFHIFAHKSEVSRSAENVKDAGQDVAHEQLVPKQSFHRSWKLLEARNIRHATGELLTVGVLKGPTFFSENIVIRSHHFWYIVVAVNVVQRELS